MTACPFLATPFLATLGPGELFGLIIDTTFFGKGILLVLLVLSIMSAGPCSPTRRAALGAHPLRAPAASGDQLRFEWLDGDG
jgi:hypothetical protein